MILTYLLIAERGFKTATLATDSFSKLLATGLTAVMALQVFVIIGGVTRVIPLTGVTLPFVSYGGSSIVANFVLLALLLLISNRARQPRRRERADLPPVRAVRGDVRRAGRLQLALGGVRRAAAAREHHNSRVVLEEQRIKRGVIRAADGAVLAGSTSLSGDRYTRRYPTGKLFAQAVGFDNVQFGRAGLEKQYNDALVGRKEELSRLLDSISHKDRVGDNLQTTLDPKAQKVAYAELRATTARSSRSTSRPAPCACWPARRRSTRPTRARRARRSSTTRPRASIRPARRSRPSPRPRRSTPASTSPTRRSAARTGR